MHEEPTPRRPTTQDLTGKTYEWLTVEAFAGYRKGVPYWQCRCQCGNSVTCAANNLHRHMKSCGCRRKHTAQLRTEDLLGHKFERLTVIAFAGYRDKGGRPKAHWECRCIEGNMLIVEAYDLKKRHTRSCGCLKLELLVERSTTHGKRQAPEYVIWNDMKLRCSSENMHGYENYGGRGIRVCERWQESFQAFYDDMGPRPSPRHSLDRYPDQNGPYAPENCRWATPQEQSRNRRTNVVLTWNGRSAPIATWAEETGIKPATLAARHRNGWSDEETLTKPVAAVGVYHPRRNHSSKRT